MQNAGNGLPQTTTPPAGAENVTAGSDGLIAAFLAAPREPPATKSLTLANTSGLAISFRHSGWMNFRKKVEKALHDCPEVSPRRLQAFQCCGEDAYVECRFFGVHKNEEFRLRSTKCHDRFCVPCSQDRSRRIRDALAAHMAKLSDLKLLTLTLAHSETPLREQLDRITRHFKALRQLPIWKKHVHGGVATIEAKLGDDKLWHVHYHIVMRAKFIPQKDLSEAWLKLTADSMIVDVRKVGAKSGAIQYITKYITKATDAGVVSKPDRLIECVTAFHKRRLVATFGDWRGVVLTENSDAEQESQTLHPTPWVCAGPLDAIIRSAAEGDPRCLRILMCIRPSLFTADTS